MKFVKYLENLVSTENKPNTPFWRIMKTKYSWRVPALVLATSIPISLVLAYIDPKPVRTYLGLETSTTTSTHSIERTGYTNETPYQSNNFNLEN